jgi:hypothetical protein
VYPTIERAVRIRGIYDAYGAADAATGSPLLTPFDGDVLLGEEQELLDRMGYQGYEMGAVAHGSIGPVDYMAGVFNGTGSDTPDDTDGKAFAGRVTVGMGESLPLTLGAGVSHQEIAVDDGQEAVDGTAFELDAEWGEFRRRGLHALAEATTGTNLASDTEFRAVQAIVTWFVSTGHARVEGIEPLGRISWGDPDDGIDGDDGVLVTPGLTLYFSGRNRLMFNWDVFVPADDRFKTVHALRAQAAVAF